MQKDSKGKPASRAADQSAKTEGAKGSESGSRPAGTDDPKKGVTAAKDPADLTDAIKAEAAAPKFHDPTGAHETIEFPKNSTQPQARFGHTITMVNKYKVVLFGGATGDTGKYSMTGEAFMFNMFLKTWTELSIKGVAPSPRAAHASTNVEQMQMIVYGGATGGGSLASDDLYLLDMRNGED